MQRKTIDTFVSFLTLDFTLDELKHIIEVGKLVFHLADYSTKVKHFLHVKVTLLLVEDNFRAVHTTILLFYNDHINKYQEYEFSTIIRYIIEYISLNIYDPLHVPVFDGLNIIYLHGHSLLLASLHIAVKMNNIIDCLNVENTIFQFGAENRSVNGSIQYL
ncbi:hypothetical protein ACJX0J_021360, partial [Zea mays]